MNPLWLLVGLSFLTGSVTSQMPCLQPYGSALVSKQVNSQQCLDLSEYSDNEKQLFLNLEEIREEIKPEIERASKSARNKFDDIGTKEQGEVHGNGSNAWSHHRGLKDDRNSKLLALTATKLISDRYQVRASAAGVALHYMNLALPEESGKCDPKIKCDPESKYRTLDGSCNNLRNPSWGMSMTAFQRMLAPDYGDGIMSPRVSMSEEPLPNSRFVSRTFFPDVNIPDTVSLLTVMNWGQFVSHDLASSGNKVTERTGPCCTPDGKYRPAEDVPETCFPVNVPKNDPFYSKYNVRCMNVERTFIAPRPDCTLGPNEQLNENTHFLDASTIYGSDNKTMEDSRTYVGGELKSQIRNGQEFPPQHPNPTGTCDVDTDKQPCFTSGDSRINENPQLTVRHVIMFREHNRVAKELSRLNPQWDDERIYQETRRIVAAEVQHITYYEWLPVMIGKVYAEKIGLFSPEPKFSKGYRHDINPSVVNAFTTSAFRRFHSMVQGDIGFGNVSNCPIFQLKDFYNRPGVLTNPPNMDCMIEALTTQPSSSSDEFFTVGVTHFLFKERKVEYGLDLEAIDIHRGRDHGLNAYNNFRALCGLRRARSFDDFADVIAKENIVKLKEVYAHPNDVDLFVGGTLEMVMPETLMGPTFLCIFVEQMHRTKFTDRFFYTLRGQPGTFTKGQLAQIYKVSISRLFCDHGVDITEMPVNGFLLRSETNPVVSCDDIPRMDLRKWKE